VPGMAQEKLTNAVKIETVDLATRGVRLPSNRVGMVVAQPFVTLSETEPYRWTATGKPKQLKVLADTLAISRTARHGAGKTHFTIFPEYSIPGMDGIAVVETALKSADWPVGTIVIGGTDGLCKAEISELADGPLSYLESAYNGVNLIGEHEWVNCGITWVKAQDGTLERWLQPKLHPAWPEMNITYEAMFRGHSIYLFKGLLDNDAPFRFGSLICFDWIATVEAKKSSKWILEDLHQQANGYQIPLSWLFVIQHNAKPSHNTFLREVEAFYDQTQYPNAVRNNACLVFANNAGLAKPGKIAAYGGCSLVFSDRAGFRSAECAPTFSNGGTRFRDGSDLLNAYKDVVFRERGACIHSFAQINPASLAAGPAGRALAIENAHVHTLTEEADPRTPGDAVPACVKWINDELDGRAGLNSTYPTVPLATALDATHKQTVAALRLVKPKSITHCVALAAQGSQAKGNADEWDRIESEAIEHLVDTLDIVSLGTTPPSLGADPAHATIALVDQTIDVLVIRGISHESCIEHSKTFLPLPRRKSLLVSRDLHNNAWSQRFGSFLEPVAATLNQEQKFTDPASGLLHLGFRRLLDVFLGSTNVEDVQGALNAELAA
jgi:hypothetical protein